LYGDVVEELDASVGEILATIKRLELDRNTLVIFASDNGPFLSYGEHAGRAKPLREGKLTTFEGGVRVPCIVRWPGKIAAGTVTDELATMMDWLPTFAMLLGAELPRPVDGREIGPLLFGELGAESPHEVFYYYSGDELHAVRSGKWKLHFPHDYLTTAAEPGKGGKPSNFGKLAPAAIEQSSIRGIASRHGYRVEQLGLSLFDLANDVGETRNVAAEQPEIVAQLTKLAETARADLGDLLTNRRGANRRPAGEYRAD
jgi:arylsulfatase